MPRSTARCLSRDRAQGVFRQTFLEFSRRSVSANRMQVGARKMKQYAKTFARAEAEYGVPAPVITAFWGLETDFGAVQGDFNTMNALATLAHDCRRPELFRPQLIAAIEMVGHGDLDPNGTTGAWAGEIGQVQMLPRDIIEFGVDGDGDGHVNLKTSSEDAIMTAAKFIRSLGWRAGEPWFAEVSVPSGNFPYEKSGLRRHDAERLDRARRQLPQRPADLAEPACRPAAPAGAQRPGLPGVSEFLDLSRMEPELHLHHVGGLLRHEAGRCQAL
jgi:lytic murein transglycosylase